MLIPSVIDPHVHLRGTEYETPYAKYAFDDARACGIVGLFEMPNPTPNLITPESVAQRKAALEPFATGVYHGIHIGLTNDKTQVKQALASMPISDKIFYTHSTGDMGICDPDMQEWIWRYKGAIDYRGVSIGHFEDAAEYTGTFDYKDPLSHSLRQNPDAELLSVERQLTWAQQHHFQGTFYIAHVSNPETLLYVNRNFKFFKFRIVTEVTWHHMFLNWTDYARHGNFVKMNPPLRSQALQERLLQLICSFTGHIIIGSDHAPHDLAKKDSNKPPSGIPALPFWPKGIELLIKYGMSDSRINMLVNETARTVFKLPVSYSSNYPITRMNVTYNPTLWDKYGWNPFSRVDGTEKANA